MSKSTQRNGKLAGVFSGHRCSPMPLQKCTRNYDRKAEVDMAAGDDDLVMVVFLALTLVEDPTVLARPLPSFDSLVSNFHAHILIP